jgi:SAM-dependent methyltransferase
MALDASFLGPRNETVYAHKKRWNWIRQHLEQSDRIVELGCGTGCMLTLPLLKAGFDIIGVDRDESSIAYGRSLAVQVGLSDNSLFLGELADLPGKYDVVIASEVLEHLDEAQLSILLASVYEALRAGGMFLITVPNGFGWYEFESWIWNKCGLGWLLSRTRLERTLMLFKVWLSGKSEEQMVEQYPSSLDTSPHVQRFTLQSLEHRLVESGFHVVEKTGSAIISGQFSNLLFTGYNWLTSLNASLADRMPALSSGFYFACKKDETELSIGTAGARGEGESRMGKVTTEKNEDGRWLPRCSGLEATRNT